jgi:hypothetical protein
MVTCRQGHNRQTCLTSHSQYNFLGCGQICYSDGTFSMIYHRLQALGTSSANLYWADKWHSER